MIFKKLRALGLTLIALTLLSGYDVSHLLKNTKVFGSIREIMYSKKSLNFVSIPNQVNPEDMKYTEQWLSLGIESRFSKGLQFVGAIKTRDYWGYTPLMDLKVGNKIKTAVDEMYVKYSREFGLNFKLKAGKFHKKYASGLILDTYKEKQWGLYGVQLNSELEPMHFELFYLMGDAGDSALYGTILGYEDRRNPKNRVNWDLYALREQIKSIGVGRWFLGVRFDAKTLGQNFERWFYAEAYKPFGVYGSLIQRGIGLWLGKKTVRYGEKTNTIAVWNYGYGGAPKTSDKYNYDSNSFFSHFGFGRIFRDELLGRQKTFSGRGLYGRHIINFHYQTDFKFGLSSGFDFVHLHRAEPLATLMDMSNSLGNEFDFFFVFRYNKLALGGAYCYLVPGSYFGTGNPASMIVINVEVRL